MKKQKRGKQSCLSRNGKQAHEILEGIYELQQEYELL